MTTAELDALTEKLKQCHEKMTPADKWRDFGNTLYIGEAWWAMPGQRYDASGIPAIRNALPAILAALAQAKADREEVERLRMANDTLALRNRRLRLRHDPNCDSIGESSETEPKPCNCYLHAMSQNGQLRAENERLAVRLIERAENQEHFADSIYTQNTAADRQMYLHCAKQFRDAADEFARTAAAKEGTK